MSRKSLAHLPTIIEKSTIYAPQAEIIKTFGFNRYAVKEAHEYDISTILKSLRDKMQIEIKSAN